MTGTARTPAFGLARAAKRAALLATCVLGLAVAGSVHERWPGAGPPPAAAQVAGRVIVLPGIRNTRFHLTGFTDRLAEQLPGFDIEIRPWGTPLVGIGNLRDYERNRATAAALAGEIADWRRQHPDSALYLVGYSGGGGVAALTVAALPDDVSIERLVLVAPAISPDYDVGTALLPHISEFVANYSSLQDIQVGLGTRVFGTIDRKDSVSAGAVGFFEQHEHLAEWHWTTAHKALGHRGNHLGYLGRRWQNAELLPALDPAHTADTLTELWRRHRQAPARD